MRELFSALLYGAQLTQRIALYIIIFILKFPKTLKQQNDAVKLLIQSNMDSIPGHILMSIQERHIVYPFS